MSGDIYENINLDDWNRFDELQPPPHLTVLAFADGEYYFCRVLTESVIFTSEHGDVETFDRSEESFEIMGYPVEYWALLPDIPE